MDEARIPDDVWLIQHIPQRDKTEYLGYPTQKPEALLETVITASSEEGDLVLDPFCGCGTTLAVAQRLGRRWVGVDVSPKAIDMIKTRLTRCGATKIKVVGVPKGIKELKKLQAFEFQNWVVDVIGGTHSAKKVADKGIDGFTYLEHNPVQIKQSERVGRNVVDNFETAIRREGKKKGEIYAFSFTKSAYEEAARVKRKEELEIKLITIQELPDSLSKRR